MDETWTTARLLKWTADYLAQRQIESPRLEAELLLAKAIGCSRIDLYTRFDEEAPEDARVTFRSLVKQRAEGMPTAYLIGEKEFFSYSFNVTPDVLIPRPETEHLVTETLDLVKRRFASPVGNNAAASPSESAAANRSAEDSAQNRTSNIDAAGNDAVGSEVAAVETVESANTAESAKTERIEPVDPVVAKESEPQNSDDTQIDELTGESYIRFKPKESQFAHLNLSILDLGTGSGIIPVCLAKNLPMAQFVAVDISSGALKVAKENAVRHKVRDRIDFRQGDLFGPIDDRQKFDFIVSNPPYIGESEMPTLDASVREYEPQLALCGGPKGTEIVERILESAAAYIKPGGYVLIEISPVIHESVVELCQCAVGLTYQTTVLDLSRLPRIVVLSAPFRP